MKYLLLILFLIPSIAFASKAPATDIHIMDNPCTRWYAPGEVEGCVRYATGHIELLSTLDEESMHWLLGHEEGHWYLHNHLGKFQKFHKDEEENMDIFADWISGYEIPAGYEEIFQRYCDSKCVQEIKNIKLK